MKSFKLLPLALAVSAISSVTAQANEVTADSVVDLGSEVVKIDRQGAKIKTNVVTSSDKDERTETDLRGLLKEEPAIDFGGGNGTSQYISIRGMGQNSIDVKVDNAYSDSQFLYHQGRFMLDPSLVKIVSVQKGAGSASAGIGATNGAIVARTVDAADLLRNSDKDWGVRVNAGYSDNDGHSYGVAAFGQNDKFDYLIMGNRVDEDNYKAGKGYLVNGSNEVPYSALEKTSYLAKVGANFGNHRVVLSHKNEEHAGVRLVREEFYTALDNPRLSPDRQAPAYRETSQSITNLEYLGNNLGNTDINANIYQMNAKRVSADDAANGYAGRIAGETETNIDTVGANINFDTHANDTTLVKYGINYRNQEAKPHALRNGAVNQEKMDVGAYVEAIGDIGDVTATLGMRYDHFEFTAMDGKKVSDGAMNPSLGLIWQATPALSFNANHNYATRSPRMYDTLRAHGGAMVSISDATKAEKARNTEVGFNYNHSLGDKGDINLNGSYFWQKITDALGDTENRDNHSNAARVIINQGEITNEGYELGAAYMLGGFKAQVGVAESQPEFHNTAIAERAEYASPMGRIWTSALSYRFNEPNLEIGVRNRSAEKAKHALTVGGEVTDRPSYSVTDLYANWKPYGSDKMNVNLALNNISDEKYVPHSQSSGILAGASEVNAMPGVGRELRVGVNYTF